MEQLSRLNRDTYVLFVCQQIWAELPQVLWSGLLFSLCAAPAFVLFALGFLAPTLLIGVITIAPAWAALFAIQLKIVSDGALPSRHFGYSLRQYWRRSVQLGLLAAFPILVMLIILPLLRQAQIPLFVWFGLGADFFAIALVAALLLYAFPLLIIHNDGGVQTTLRNAWILAGRYPFHTLGLLGMWILFGFGIGYFSLGLLFFLPPIFSLFVSANCLLVLQEEQN